MNDIPYSTLKENQRMYEIMLLRDQYDNTFAEIAKEYALSAVRVRSLYNRVKIRQIRLYIHHLSVINGHENTSEFRKLWNQVNDCYRNFQFGAAYLEKAYKQELTLYRNGEPGMPEEFVKHVPPFRTSWSNKTIFRIIQMREVERMTYAQIGKRLRMTRDKAEDLYQSYYHQKVLSFMNQVAEKYNKKRWELFDVYFRSTHKAKKRYDLIVQDYPNILDE